MTAAPPKRATSSATLAFGPLSIPVQLFAGTERARVERSEYTKDGEPVGRAPVIKGSDPPELVDYADVIRCVETEHGLVELTDEEIAEVYDLPEKQADIEAFLPLHVMGAGRYMPEQLMQVRPAKGKKRGTFDPAAAKAFALLLKALRQEQAFALVRLNLRGSPAYGALLPTGRMYRLMFDEQVREDLPMPEIDVSAEEVDMVRKLMDVRPHPPELTNEARERLLAYVDEKAREGNTIDRKEDDGDDVDEVMKALREATE